MSYLPKKSENTIFDSFYGPAYQLTVFFPVHKEPIEGVTPGISDQLPDNHVLNPMQEVLQASRLQLIMVLLEELLCRLVLWLRLGTADGSWHSLDLCLSTVHHSGLTASLKYQQIKVILFRDAHQSYTNCNHSFEFHN